MPTVTATWLDQFRKRLLADAMLEASAKYWEARATTLEKALPKPGDFTGAATPAEIEERAYRLRLAIACCRLHARLIRSSR